MMTALNHSKNLKEIKRELSGNQPQNYKGSRSQRSWYSKDSRNKLKKKMK